jgi:predicted  nucleic acid-binding Zn-ribbon protein
LVPGSSPGGPTREFYPQKIEGCKGLNEQLERLIKLQQIDLKLRAVNHVIEEFPSRTASAELPLKESQVLLSSSKQKLESSEKKKRDKERELEEIDDKVRKLKARTVEIKTNKEYQALLKEVESFEKQRSEREDEILLIMEESDTASKQIKAEEAKFRTAKDKVEALKKKLGDEKSEVEKELLTIKEERTRIAQTVDKEIYELYMSLMEACNGLAVTEAKEEICQGCNMNIPPQLFVELKKNEDIISCPQCRRILYFRNNE